jgi:hypothetical protein
VRAEIAVEKNVEEEDESIGVLNHAKPSAASNSSGSVPGATIARLRRRGYQSR